MAYKNGNTVSGGSASAGTAYSWYCIVEATQTGDTATTRTYSVKLKYYTKYAIDVHSNGALSGGVSGSWSGSMTGTNSGTTKTVITKSVTVNKGSSSKSVSFTGYVQNTGGFGNGKSSATLTVSVPAITYSAPNAPSGCSATRGSDTSATVKWTNGSTSTTKPRSNVLLERQTDGGSWTQIAKLSASTVNYTDSTISANHRYAYRVRSYGAGGYSGYATSGYIYTTPAKPSMATATKQAATTVLIEYGTATYATGYEVERYYEGSWTALGTSTTGSYTDSSAPAGTVKYRVRSVRDSLKSAYTETNEVTTIVAPNAPTITSKPSTVLEVGSPASLSWSPNHPDGSSQTKAQIGYALDGGGETTVDVSGAVTSWAFPESVTGSPHKVKARVRTYGLYEDWGAWSSYVEFQLAYAPSVNFTFPATDDAKIAALPIGVTWDAEDSTGIASQTLKLYRDGNEVLSRTFSGDVRDFDITPDVYIPTNGMEYLLTLSVTGGSSLQSSAQRSFVTAYTGPREPNAAIDYDDSLAASILVSQGDLMPENIVTTLEDVTYGAMLPGLEVYGNTRQNLWKNPPNKTANGVTLTNNKDGSITVSGTNTGVIYFTVDVYSLSPGKSYVLSIDNKPVPALQIGVSFRYSDGGYISQTMIEYSTEKSKAFNVPLESSISRMTVRTPDGGSTGNTISGTYRVMLREATDEEIAAAQQSASTLQEGGTADIPQDYPVTLPAYPIADSGEFDWCPPGLTSVSELSLNVSGSNMVNISEKNIGNSPAATVDPESGSVSFTPNSTAYLFFQPGYLSLQPGQYVLQCGFISKATSGRHSIAVSKYTDSGAINVVSIDADTEKSVSFKVENSYTKYALRVVSSASTEKVSATGLRITKEPTSYEPYVGSSTPIDLQGNVLSSLPDGTRDVLTVDANGACSIESPVGYIASYNGEDVGTEYIASDLTADGGIATGAQVVYIRDEPATVELGSIDIPELPSPTANVWMSANIEATHSIVYPEAVSYSVSRVSDGKKTSIATGLEDGETAYDPIPPLNTDYFYEVTAYDAAGAPKSSLKPAKVDAGKKAAYNFGVDGQTCVVMPNVTSQSAEDSMGGTSYDFATGDMSLPVFYPSGNVEASRSMGHACEYPKAKELRQTVRQNPVGWVRDPLGEVTYCRLTYSDSLKTGKPVMADVTVKCEENEWTEPSY